MHKQYARYEEIGAEGEQPYKDEIRYREDICRSQRIDYSELYCILDAVLGVAASDKGEHEDHQDTCDVLDIRHIKLETAVNVVRQKTTRSDDDKACYIP